MGHVDLVAVVVPVFVKDLDLSVAQNCLPARCDSVDRYGLTVLPSSERTGGDRFSGPQHVAAIALVHLLGCGVEAGHVELELRFGLDIEIEALAVVHVDAIGHPGILDDRSVTVDAVIHVETVGIAGIGDRVDSGVFRLLVVELDVGIGLSRRAQGEERGGDDDKFLFH